jgi:hypothetical protein
MLEPMRTPVLAPFLALCLALLGGCATAPPPGRDPAGNPRIERLTPEQLGALGPASPARLSLEEVVGMSRAGTPADAIIDRIWQSGSRFALSDADRASLRSRGVSETVIAFIDSHERDAQRIDALTRQADADAQARRRQDAAARAPLHRDPYWWGPRVSPYLGYGWGPWGSGWRGGVGIGF